MRSVCNHFFNQMHVEVFNLQVSGVILAVPASETQMKRKWLALCIALLLFDLLVFVDTVYIVIR